MARTKRNSSVTKSRALGSTDITPDFAGTRKLLAYIASESKSFETQDIDYFDDEELEDEANTATYEISFIELAILNGYFHSVYKKGSPDLKIEHFGWADSVGRVNFAKGFDVSDSFWYFGCLNDDPNTYIFHTKVFKDTNNTLITQLHISAKKGSTLPKLDELFKRIKKLAFNNSNFKGKCLKVKLYDGRFRGIEIIEVPKTNDLILNPTQQKYVNNFISRVRRGSNTRYLFNGTPGSGKTESIRDIVRQLMPDVTFVIPDFATIEDLTTILEACEIFDNAVIIMDDIDLFLGSRDNGSYTKLLGEFLSFFDGVKKRKISLLASTNDKGLVDAAAERPGRFNMTLDYTFLTEEQIEAVCNIHLPEPYRVKEVYLALSDKIDGKKAKITGAFIANLAENIKEMAQDDEEWKLQDTIDLIKESYRGFYSSQIKKDETIGFKP
jgi:hypothetical protein